LGPRLAPVQPTHSAASNPFFPHPLQSLNSRRRGRWYQYPLDSRARRRRPDAGATPSRPPPPVPSSLPRLHLHGGAVRSAADLWVGPLAAGHLPPFLPGHPLLQLPARPTRQPPPPAFWTSATASTFRHQPQPSLVLIRGRDINPSLPSSSSAFLWHRMLAIVVNYNVVQDERIEVEILSLSRDDMSRIRGAVSPSVVSVWEETVDGGGKKCVMSCRSGFVFKRIDDRCIVITLSKGLVTLKRTKKFAERKIFVRDVHGSTFEGSAVYDHENESNLAAVVVCGLNNAPMVDVLWSEIEAQPGDAVVHVGTFNKDKTELNFSSGMVGLIGHTSEYKDRQFSRFSHGCSRKLYLVGAPVFNLGNQLVGLNFSQKKEKDLFFAMDLAQLEVELEILFGCDIECGCVFLMQVKSLPYCVSQRLRRCETNRWTCKQPHNKEKKEKKDAIMASKQNMLNRYTRARLEDC
ncbi:hypothetical protein EJB05_32148, partial [Eragrostis curvula]